MLKSLIVEVLKSLSFFAPRRAHPSDVNEETDAAKMVPEDVIEGHFAVVAIKDAETKRFIVELDYLTDPDFLRLLEQAKEEFGFGQKGALALPCRPEELQKILENRRADCAPPEVGCT